MSVLDAVDLSGIEITGRLALAVGLGTAVGVQRELDGHDAGIRTHALVTLGSALFGVMSVAAFGRYITVRADTNVQVDVTRIASYLVAGVGFLAGGAIVKQSDRVRGLTTAASIWVVAAIGLAAGLGFFLGAIVTAAATLVLLVLDDPIAKVLKRDSTVSIRAVVSRGTTVDDLFYAVAEKGFRPRRVSRSTRQDAAVEIRVEGIPARYLKPVMALFEQCDELIELSYEQD